MNETRLEKRLIIEGRKYFSNIVCSGERTWFKLQQLKQASKLKLLMRLEFDPLYIFCGEKILRENY